MNREAMWVSLDERTFEHVSVKESADEIIADGSILHVGDASYRIHYVIHCDSKWRVRKLEMTREWPTREVLLLQSDGSGQWTDGNNNAVAGLKGCLDVDIYASPFTNTLAIRRLHLKPQQAEKLKVVFIQLPELKPVAVGQRYTHLSSESEHDIYKYEGLDSGYTVELPVDPDGILTEYPGFFKRIWTR